MTATLPSPAEILDELVIEMTYSVPEPAETPFDEVCRLLDQLLKVYGPDYTYPEVGRECHYLDLVSGSYDYGSGGDIAPSENLQFKPSCLVGAVLFEVKDPLSLAYLYDSNNSEGISSIEGFFPQEWLDDAALMVSFGRLQSQQDQGVTWGEAVEEFKYHYPYVAQEAYPGNYWATDGPGVALEVVRLAKRANHGKE